MKVSYSTQICIKEICKAFPMYKYIGILQCSLIFAKFKNDTEAIFSESEFSNYEAAILKLSDLWPCNLIEYSGSAYYNNYCLSDKGRNLIRLIKARKQTRYLLKKGCDLFPETAKLMFA